MDQQTAEFEPGFTDSNHQSIDIIRRLSADQLSEDLDQQSSAMDQLSQDLKSCHNVKIKKKKSVKKMISKKDLILERKKKDYTSGCQNPISNTKLTKALKNKIKKCRNCKSDFKNNEAMKVYFPPFDYTFCNNCQFVLTQPNFKYKYYLTQPYQAAINNLYKKCQKMREQTEDSQDHEKYDFLYNTGDKCVGEFCGKPSQAGRKAAGRFWRKINYLTKNNVEGIEELLNEHNRHALELFESNKRLKTFENMNKINLKNKNIDSLVELNATNVNGYLVYPLVKTVLERKRKIYYVPDSIKGKNHFHFNYLNDEDQFTVKKIRLQPKRFYYSAIFSKGKHYLQNLKTADQSANPIDTTKSDIVWNCNVYAIKNDSF